MYVRASEHKCTPRNLTYILQRMVIDIIQGAVVEKFTYVYLIGACVSMCVHVCVCVFKYY